MNEPLSPAAQAAPTPQPTLQDEALIALDRIESGDASYGDDDFNLVRCALANRVAHVPTATLLPPASAVVPVAVSERLPTMEAGDFDREGRCWWGDPGGEQFVPSWRLCNSADDSHFTYWLPAHAIPLPQAGEVET